MKCQIVFSRKNKKKIISLSSADFAHSVLRVNGMQVLLSEKNILTLIQRITPCYALVHTVPHSYASHFTFPWSAKSWTLCTHMWLAGLEFNSPVNAVKVMLSWSVYIATLFLGRLSPLAVDQNLCTFFYQKLTLFFVNQQKGENDQWKYFMINLHERILLDPADTKPTTSWSPVGRASDWAT